MSFRHFALLAACAVACSSLHAQETPTAPSAQAPSSTTQTPSSPSSTAPLTLQSLPPDPHTLSPEEQKQAQQQRMLAAATQLAKNQANWGPAMSSPGTTLTMKEAGRTASPEGAAITYTITATGFDAGDPLKLLRWPLDSNVQLVVDGLTVDGTGHLICPAISKGDCLKTMKPGAPVEIKTTAADGEAIRIAVIDDSKKHAAALAVPFAVAASDRGCELEMLRGVKNAALVLIEGHGFPANSAVTLDTSSYDDKHPVNTKSDANGSLVVALLPATGNHTSGQTTVHYGGSTCSPTLSFNWGEDTYKPHS